MFVYVCINTAYEIKLTLKMQNLFICISNSPEQEMGRKL